MCGERVTRSGVPEDKELVRVERTDVGSVTPGRRT